MFSTFDFYSAIWSRFILLYKRGSQFALRLFRSAIRSCLGDLVGRFLFRYSVAPRCSDRANSILLCAYVSALGSVGFDSPVQSCYGVRTVRFLFGYAVVFWCSRYAVLFGRLRSGFRLDLHGGVFLIFRARYLDKRLSSSLLSWRSFSSLGVSETTCLR